MSSVALFALTGLASLQLSSAYPLFSRAAETAAAAAGDVASSSVNGSQLFNRLDGFGVLESNFTHVVTFGDSLSDAGSNGLGLYHQTGGLAPVPAYWYNGRFSNGPVWPEYLTRRLGVPLTDYATGGSTTDNKINIATIDLGTTNLTLPSTLDQIATYLDANTTAAEISTSLHVIFAGGNDLLDVLGGKANVTGAEVAKSVSTGLDALQAAGAQHVVLVNLPSLIDTPAARSLTNSTIAYLDGFSSTYRDGLIALESDNVTMSDTYNAISYVRAHADDFGLNATTFTQSCQIGISTEERSLDLQYSRCKDQDSYLFWNSVHPTTHGHQIVTDIIAGALTRKGWVTSA